MKYNSVFDYQPTTALECPKCGAPLKKQYQSNCDYCDIALRYKPEYQYPPSGTVINIPLGYSLSTIGSGNIEF